MNAIIEQLIDWCEKNKYNVDISIRGRIGEIWILLTLRKYNKEITHAFYIAGGVLNITHWCDQRCDLELECFLEEARKAFENNAY